MRWSSEYNIYIFLAELLGSELAESSYQNVSLLQKNAAYLDSCVNVILEVILLIYSKII